MFTDEQMQRMKTSLEGLLVHPELTDERKQELNEYFSALPELTDEDKRRLSKDFESLPRPSENQIRELNDYFTVIQIAAGLGGQEE